MGQTLKIPNFSSLNIVEKADVDADVQDGEDTVLLKSVQNISADQYVLVGARGGEGDELVLVESVNGLSLTMTSNFVRPHDRFETVTGLYGNKIKMYRADDVDGSKPSVGSFTALGSPIDIDFDQIDTTFTDPDGGDAYWYGFTYYNDQTDTETDLNDCIFIRGVGSDNTNYASIESIRRKAGLANNRWIADAVIEEKRQTAQQLINSKLTGIYTLPFKDPINPLIAEITRLLAAGWLLTDDYGPLNKLDTSEGQHMLNQVTNKDRTGLLDRLNTKDLELTDQNGASTAIPGSGDGIKMWPDTTTATADPSLGGGARMFETGSHQGYGSRRY